MKRLGILALCTIAVFAVSAVATATDELPEVGRCVKLAGTPTHRYANPACTIRSEGENTGKYEWEPGPGPKPGFTSTIEASELETVGKVTMKCHGGTGTGEFTGRKSDAATLTFTGCEYGSPGGVPCRTPGAKEGEVLTSRLEGSIGYISGGGTSQPVVGIRLAPASGTQVASVECGGMVVTLSGSIIGALAATTEKMVVTSTLKFKASKGKQNPEHLEGGVTSVLSAGSGSSAEQAGLTSTETNTNEEPLEVRAIG
jgi:hypothetical protein